MSDITNNQSLCNSIGKLIEQLTQERDQWQQRTHELEQKLDAIKNAGHANDCAGIDMEHDRCGCGWLQTEGAHEYIRILEKRAERSEQTCAEMREVLEKCERMLRFTAPNKDFNDEWHEAIRAAQDAQMHHGKNGYLSPAELREKVKPLVDALQWEVEHVGGYDRQIAIEALDHARKEGLI